MGKSKQAWILAAVIFFVFSVMMSGCGGGGGDTGNATDSSSPQAPESEATYEDGQGAGEIARSAWGTEVGEYLGVKAYSNGQSHNVYGGKLYYKEFGYQYQCVEYVNRFLVKAKNHRNLRGTGHAKHYWTKDTTGLIKISNAGSSCPQEGDVIVSSYGEYGHVAVVRAITSDSIYVIQQNWSNNDSDGSYRLAYDYDGDTCEVKAFGGGKYTVAGWLRVPDDQPDPVIPAYSPGNVSASYQKDHNRNYITWSSVPGATSYKIYWSTSAGVTANNAVLTPTTTTSYGHSGVVGGYTYYYRVQALNRVGGSDLSTEVHAYVPADITRPLTPQNIQGVYQAANNWNYITWSGVAGATSYKVYWGTSPGVSTGSNVLSPTVTTAYGHSGVVGGNTYYYRVRAVNSAGSSDLSNEISVRIPSTVNPAIAQTPLSGPAGTTFSQWGSGFTPNTIATLHFQKPDGTEYPTDSQAINSNGTFSITYPSPTNKAAGKYTWWAVDGRTGKVSNSVTYTITIKPTIAQTPMSGPAGTTYSQWGTGFTPNSTATLHFRKPDGTEYPTASQAINSSGTFSITYPSPTNKPSGTYTWWAVDGPSGKSSNYVSYKIN